MSEFLNDATFEKFRDLIYNASGIHFSSSNRTILESRLKERLKKSELSSVEEYLVQINKDAEELKVSPVLTSGSISVTASDVIDFLDEQNQPDKNNIKNSNT